MTVALKMKKLFLVLGGVLMVLSFSGCGTTGGSQVDSAGSSGAQAVSPNFRTGWNLGNALDANNFIDKPTGGNQGLNSETCWGMPKTTQAMIQGIADSGIQVIRIPTSWSNHVTDGNYTIDGAWMARVKEIVGWALDAGLTVILNCHHDNYFEEKSYVSSGWGYYPSAAGREKSLKFVTRVWEQVAPEFRDVPADKLIFETLNEPRLRGDRHEWNFEKGCSKCEESMAVINEMNQAAVNTIRASGGENAARMIMVPSYVASPYGSVGTPFKMPSDSANNLCLSAHAYTPYNFAMQKNREGGTSQFTAQAKSDIDYLFKLLDDNFVSKGIPVIIGEYGATNKNNLKARLSWFDYYLGKAREIGIPCILWDNNAPENPDESERFGYYNRGKQTWYFPEILDAIVGN